MSGRLVRILAATAAMMIVQMAHSGGEPPEYEVEVIPGPFCGIFGWEPAVGLGINDLGNICGYNFDCNNDDQPFFWSPKTGRVTLDVPPTTLRGRALDLNGQDEIVGWCDHSQPNAGRYGFVYRDGEFTSLGSLPGSVFSEAHAINDKREIAGAWIDNADTGLLRALLWRDGEIIDISTDLLWLKSRANDINQFGQITGWTANSLFTDARAFIWDNGKVTDLGVIPGGFTGMGIAINNQGDVAVEGLMFNDQNEVIVRSFLWREGEWIDLGGFPGCEETRVLDLNDAGQAIGYCEGPGTFSRFLWQDGVIWELNDISESDDPEFGIISLVWAINNTAQIAGDGSHTEFGGPAIRLTPIVSPLGDLDGDGSVGVPDLLILLGAWGPCADCNDCPADIDGDCSVGVKDLLILLGNWG